MWETGSQNAEPISWEATTRMQDEQSQRRETATPQVLKLLADAVVGQGAFVLRLLPREDELLLVRRHA